MKWNEMNWIFNVLYTQQFFADVQASVSYYSLSWTLTDTTLQVLWQNLDGYYSISVNGFFALGSPLAGVIISFAFISSILDAIKKNAVNWKDRLYTIKVIEIFHMPNS